MSEHVITARPAFKETRQSGPFTETITSAENINIPARTVSTAYGLYLVIDDDLREWILEVHNANAERCVEIVIKIDGVVYEMTLAQFAKRIVGDD